MLCHALHHAVHKAAAHDLPLERLHKLVLQAAVRSIADVHILKGVIHFLAGNTNRVHLLKPDGILRVAGDGVAVVVVLVTTGGQAQQEVLVRPMRVQALVLLAVRVNGCIAGDANAAGSLCLVKEQHDRIAARVVLQVGSQHIGGHDAVQREGRSGSLVHQAGRGGVLTTRSLLAIVQR